MLGEGDEPLSESSFNLHLGPFQLSSSLQQFDQIVQVNYRSERRIFPGGLIDLVGIDHVARRVVGNQYACRVRLQDLGELSEGVACLLQHIEGLVEFIASPFELRVQLASVTIIGHCDNLPTTYTGARADGGLKRCITGTPVPAKHTIEKTPIETT